MKKILTLLTISSLTLAGTANAAQISESQAAEIAQKYMRTAAGQRLLLAKSQNQTPETAAYYAFNAGNGNGFVIVSGDDSLTELIGYSDSGSFSEENMPENLKSWLDTYVNYVERVQQGESKAIKNNVLTATPVVEPFVTTHWNQMEPYNNMCPVDSRYGAVPVGCVATAMAQIMNYWEWPATGKGSNRYTSNYGIISVDFSKSNYDWDNMLDDYIIYKNPDNSYSYEYNETEANAVAKLMYDCGVSVDMMYAASASGAYDVDVPVALANHFNYNAELLTRNSTSGQQFFNAVKAELDAKRPVLFGGSGSGGGHAFVIDGYDSNNYLHVNWGWGGLSDGYFNMDLMDPYDLGTGGGTGGFNIGQTAIFANPDKEGEGSYGQSYLLLANDLDFVTSATSVLKGDPFQVTVYYPTNTNSYTYVGNVGVAVFAKDGTRLTEPTNSQQVQIPAWSYTMQVTSEISDQLKNLEDGIYNICAVSKEIRTGYTFDWLRLDTPQKLAITVSGNEITLGGAPNELELTAPLSLDKKNAELNGEITVSASIYNKSEELANGSLAFEIRNKATNGKVSSKSATVFCYGGSETTTSTTFKLSSNAFKDGETYVIRPTTFTSSTTGIPFDFLFDDSNACEFTIGENGGISTVNSGSEVKVYPNPVGETMHIDSSAQIISTDIYSAEGRLVKSTEGQNAIDVAELTPGYYVAIIATENGTVRIPIIKK